MAEPDSYTRSRWPGGKVDGLELLAGAGFTTPPDERKIRWVREANGAVVAEISVTRLENIVPTAASMKMQLFGEAGKQTDIAMEATKPNGITEFVGSMQGSDSVGEYDAIVHAQRTGPVGADWRTAELHAKVGTAGISGLDAIVQAIAGDPAAPNVVTIIDEINRSAFIKNYLKDDVEVRFGVRNMIGNGTRSVSSGNITPFLNGRGVTLGLATCLTSSALNARFSVETATAFELTLNHVDGTGWSSAQQCAWLAVSII